MKKLLAVIFSLLLALALFSCGDTEEQNDSENGTTSSTAHTHAYGEWVVVTLPGCETEGEEKRECGCGDIQTQPVASLGHTERVLERREPTCSVAGLTEGKDCSECGAILVAQAEIPTLSHTEKVLEYKAPTCTETGLTEGKMCTDCGETLLAQDIIPASHTEETVEGYAATCYETGLTDGKKCTVCGETTLEQEIIPISHVSEIVPAVEPDCYNTGLTEGKRCAICKTPLIPQYEVPQKHEPTVVEGYAPDCFNDGKKDGISCSLCGKVIQEQEIIPAHHELVLSPGKIATCTETGLTNGYECSVCKNVIIEQEEIPYTLHNFVNGNCTHCTITEFSQGFEYTLSEDGTYYILSGRGTCKDLKVIIPEMYMGKPVKEISSACFSSDYNLISIVIPSTIEKIGSNGFTYAYRLIEVYNLSTHINLVYGEPTGLYSVAKAIHTALDEESVLKQHGDFIFAELTMGGASLVAYTGNDAKVVLPDSYNDQKYKIHSYAFNDCRKMVSVTVPNGVAEVGTGAFSRCISLVEVYYDAGMQLEFNGSWWQGDLGKYALVINEHTNPESIINFVDDFVFVTHEGENYLVTYVGNEKHLTLPKDYKGQSYTIIKYAFENLDVESLVISSGVKAIEKSAFAQSKSLKEIIFEEGVVSIGDRAFAESGIRKIVLPNSLTQMGTNLFANCENLGCVVLGNGINTIPAYTFYSCSNLVSITLPSSLTSIADTAFFIYASNGTESADPYKLKEIINHSSLVLTIGGKDNGGIAKYAQVIYCKCNN